VLLGYAIRGKLIRGKLVRRKLIRCQNWQTCAYCCFEYKIVVHLHFKYTKIKEACFSNSSPTSRETCLVLSRSSWASL